VPQRHHAQALALSDSVEQGVALRTERLAHGRRNGRQFLWELAEGMAQAAAQTCPRNQGRRLFVVLSKPAGRMPRPR
jgi:hypothetical protein